MRLEDWKLHRAEMAYEKVPRVVFLSRAWPVHLFLLLLASLAESGGEPLQTLVQTVPRGGAGGLDVLGVLAGARDMMGWCIPRRVVWGCEDRACLWFRPRSWRSAKLAGNGAVGAPTYGKILLVGKDQENGLSEFILVQHALQLLAGLDDTVAIVAVNDENDALCVLKVMPPQRTDLVLATHVPHGELDILVLDRLDIESWVGLAMTRQDTTRRGRTDGGDGGDDFTKLELVENRRLSCGVKTHHQDSHLLLAP